MTCISVVTLSVLFVVDVKRRRVLSCMPPQPPPLFLKQAGKVSDLGTTAELSSPSPVGTHAGALFPTLPVTGEDTSVFLRVTFLVRCVSSPPKCALVSEGGALGLCRSSRPTGWNRVCSWQEPWLEAGEGCSQGAGVRVGTPKEQTFH